MNKEERAVYDKAYRKANKDKLKAYREANKDSIAAKKKIYNKQLKESEGVGVYKATYHSGIYIGSGQIYHRRVSHLNGNTRIARKLKEKAISFEVLSLVDNKEDSLELEQLVIETIGLDNLLNISIS